MVENNEHLTAAQAKEIAEKSDYIFNDICSQIEQAAKTGKCRLAYSIAKNDLSQVTYSRIVSELQALGYKVDRVYSSYEIIVEWS